MKLVIGFAAAAVLCGALATTADAQMYAKGSYYSNWNFDAGNELNDGGLNGDVFPGDGIMSGNVTSSEVAGNYFFKIATGDWSSSFPFSDVPIVTSTDNEVVFMSFDTNTYADGWVPSENIVYSSALAMPTTWGLAGSAPEFGSWDPSAGPSATFNGTYYEVTLPITNIGNHEYKWTGDGVWSVQQVGVDGWGSNAGNIFIDVTAPGTWVFRLDADTGRSWHGEASVPVEDSSWTDVKGSFAE